MVDLVERHEDCFKNILSNRHYFLEKYGMDPPIINGNEITLHRNKRSRQKNLNFKSEKKNCERESYAVTWESYSLHVSKHWFDVHHTGVYCQRQRDMNKS